MAGKLGWQQASSGCPTRSPNEAFSAPQARYRDSGRVRKPVQTQLEHPPASIKNDATILRPHEASRKDIGPLTVLLHAVANQINAVRNHATTAQFNAATAIARIGAIGYARRARPKSEQRDANCHHGRQRGRNCPTMSVERADCHAIYGSRFLLGGSSAPAGPPLRALADAACGPRRRRSPDARASPWPTAGHGKAA